MNWIFRLLQEQPFLALLLLGWLLSAVAGAVKKAGKRAEAARKGQTPPSAAQPRSAEPPWPQPQARPQPPPRPQRRQPSSEEVAAEMRRILGMEAPPAQRRKAPAPPPPVVQTPQVRRPVLTPPTITAAPLSKLSELEKHLGASIESRQLSASGSIGATQLGSLGGRASERQTQRRAAAGLVSLDDLPRLLVMAEVLGKPLALRDNG